MHIFNWMHGRKYIITLTQILTSVPLATFGAWKEESFAPEADVLAKLKATEGVTEVTAQAYVVDVL